MGMIKATSNKPTPNITFTVKKMKSFSSKNKNKTKMPTITTFIQRSMEVLARAMRQGKKKTSKMGKQEVKLQLLPNYKILYI